MLIGLCSQILVYGKNAAASRVLKHARSRALPVIDSTTITREGLQEQLANSGVCVVVDCTESSNGESLVRACIASGTHYISRSLRTDASA